MAATSHIPIIDLSGDQADVARQLVKAAEEHGFIYIRNLGKDFTPLDIDEAFYMSQKIFDAPLEEKKRCSIQTNNRGWTGMHSETLDPKTQQVGDYKEAFNFGPFIRGRAQQPIPDSVSQYEIRFNDFADSCHALCRKILYLLGLGLGVGDFFSSAHIIPEELMESSHSILRFLRYPPPSSTPHSSDDVRAGAHSDYGSVTLLFRLKGQAGLEILKNDNTWAPVPVCPAGTENDPSPPILINIGDLLSYWTNGLFRSTVHRVVFTPEQGDNRVSGESSDGPRYSIAFFCHPEGSTKLEPVPSDKVKNFRATGDAVEANPYSKRKTMTAGEHLDMRLRATYGNLYDEKK
ncbi:uncharacterized protein J7T54_002161 [Emericellopsis cladophorae]|uniref:Fe2OG dioxygenase domain-containing protein n=1 Tax=Emericellopsis cladophorae TaxID=2686198 RepID=A0A9P9Y4Q2_9HYPO|nr:uncharacterized protein J7T54_002161 [Emericellopsis cladophorae]KAI6783000.1 hypothetical protein J7T54_002161 [Emericellopsis cladophorae]